MIQQNIIFSKNDVLNILSIGSIDIKDSINLIAYFSFIFTLFLLVLFGNLLGMLPYSYTFTSQIIITFFMAIVIFLSVTIIGIARHGFGFISLFS